MKTKRNRNFLRFFVLFGLLATGVTISKNKPQQVAASSQTITLTAEAMGIISYNTYTKEITGVTFKSEEIMKGTNPKDSLQFKKSAGKIYNTTPIDGKITNIAFSQSGNISFLVSTGATANSLTGQGAKATKDMSWDITASDHQYFLINNSGNAAYVPSITITYESLSTDPSVSINSDDIELTVGQTATLEKIAKNVDNSTTFAWSSSNTAVATIDENGLVTAESPGKTSITVVMTYAGEEYTSQVIEVTVKAEPIAFTKVMSQDQIKVGGRYIITAVNNSKVVAMSSTQGGNNRQAVATTMEGEKVKETSTIQKFILEVGTKSNTFAFKTEEGDLDGQYIHAASSSSNHLKTQPTKNDNASWTIVVNETTGIAAITAQGNYSNKQLKFNPANNGLFSCYSSGQTGVSLYVDNDSLDEAATAAYNKAKVFADWLMEVDRDTEDCGDKFIEAAIMWDELETDPRDVFTSHNDFFAAHARFLNWVKANGYDSLAELDAWLAGAPATIPAKAPLTVTLLIGLLSVTTLMGYAFLQRRKKLN